jgi:hypothetical protein
MRLLTSLIFSVYLFAQPAPGPIKSKTPIVAVPEVHSSSANFTADLMGVPDTRPGTWGNQGQVTWSITFKPPTGKRTRILHVDGDFLVWPPKPIVPGSSAGVLLALSSTAPGGSIYGTWMADNTFLYLQVATMGQPSRAAYDRDVKDGGLLMPDNTMIIKVAVWLNTTGTALHMEPTFTMKYQFE